MSNWNLSVKIDVNILNVILKQHATYLQWNPIGILLKLETK